jgi:putative redox protein
MTTNPRSIVEVEETLTGRFTQRALSGFHELFVDEPEGFGGNDTGPGPYEYLLMGLGACTSMTIRMYADRKRMPLKRVRVRLGHDKIHADDCLDCETREGMVDEISREITLEGNLTADQRQKLLEIANRCPVHRTLTSEIKVRSTLAD